MKVEDTEQALTEAVCSRVREQLGSADAELAEAFARQLYRWVAIEDVIERDPLDLYGLALGHFNFARERAPGTPKVRVYNPHFEEHGWQSTHTAVEIVTDDMPFLIDSVSMELNRRGFGVHLIIRGALTDAQKKLEALKQQVEQSRQAFERAKTEAPKIAAEAEQVRLLRAPEGEADLVARLDAELAHLLGDLEDRR